MKRLSYILAFLLLFTSFAYAQNEIKTTNNGGIEINGYIRGTKSFWWSQPQHVEISSANPGASGATWVPVGADNLRGWQLNADAETLTFEGDIHADWDEESDIEIKMIFESNVANGGGNTTDTTDFQLIAYYKGEGEATNKTQTVTGACAVGQIADHELFVCAILIDYDKANNVVQIGDKFNKIRDEYIPGIVSMEKLAIRYGCSRGTISNIINNKRMYLR